MDELQLKTDGLALEFLVGIDRRHLSGYSAH
jgi:hypothetical protein